MTTATLGEWWAKEVTRGLWLTAAAERLARALDAAGSPGADAFRREVLVPLYEAVPAGGTEVADTRADAADDFWTDLPRRLLAEAGRADGTFDLVRAARADTPAAGAGAPPTDTPPAEIDLAFWWILIGDALRSWDDVCHELDASTDGSEAWRRAAAVFASRPPKGEGLFANLVGVLVESLSQDSAPAAREMTTATRRFRRVVHKAPPDWPPLAIRDVLRAIEAVEEFDRTRFGREYAPPEAELRASLGAPPGVMERAWAIVQLARTVDKSPNGDARRLDAGLWAALRRAADRLLPCDGGVSVVFDLDGSRPEAEKETDHGLTAVAVNRVGLAVLSNGEVKWKRKGRVRHPPPPPEPATTLERLASANPDLATLCRELLGTLQGYRPEPAWWAEQSDDVREKWCRLIRRAALYRDGTTITLYERLAEVGLKAVPVALDGEIRGPVFVARGSGEAAAGPPLAVRFPDGKEFAPAVWLAIAPDNRPVVETLEACAPLLFRLQREDRAWDGWNDAIWRLATADRSDRKAVDADEARKAFLAVYERARGDDELAGLYRGVAKGLYRCLTEQMGVPFEPRLDRDNLRATRLERDPGTAATIVEWVEGGRLATGDVVEVVRFGGPGQPAELKVAVGPNRAHLLPWLRLPPPTNKFLTAQAAKVRDAVWGVSGPFDLWLANTKKWLDTNEGATWFQHEARSEWGQALVGGEECFPRHEPGGRVYWPEGHEERVEWVFDAAPRRDLVREPRFGVTPARAGGMFSLGPEAEAGAPLRAAARLREAAVAVAAVRKAWQAEVATHLNGCPVLAAPGVAVLDCLPENPGAIEAARVWLATRGVTLLPGPADLDGPVVPRFDSTRDAGEMWVESYGYATADGRGRPPRLARSAGRCPVGYDRLIEALRRLGRADLAERLKEWPAVPPNDLKYHAQTFYTDFYDAGGYPLSAEWAVAAGHLAELLAARFEYQPFEAKQFADRPPSYFEYDKPGGIGTGQIAQTLRPGLVDADGKVQVRTKVVFGVNKK